MTEFEFLTQDADTLAAAIFGIIDQTENDILQYIYCATGISVDKVNLADELRIELIKRDLLKEHLTEDDDATG